MLEPTVSLSGGEALVKQGVEGLRWYDQMMGRRPRHAWMIDVCGWHEQMAQICSGLGLEAFVYCRHNPTGTAPQGAVALANWEEVKNGSAIHWIASPDGSRVLGVSPGLYCDVELQPLFLSEERLTAEPLRPLVDAVETNAVRFPAGWPLLIFGGEWDYSRPFLYRGYPSALITPKETLMIRTIVAAAALGAAALAPQPAFATDPLPGVDVNLGQNPGGIVAGAATDTAGSVSFFNLPAGRYQIAIDASKLTKPTMMTVAIGRSASVAANAGEPFAFTIAPGTGARRGAKPKGVSGPPPRDAKPDSVVTVTLTTE